MESIREINTTTLEGKLLLMAIAALTVSPSILLRGKIVDGTKMTPDEVLIEVSKVAEEVYNSEQNSERSVASKVE